MTRCKEWDRFGAFFILWNEVRPLGGWRKDGAGEARNAEELGFVQSIISVPFRFMRL